VTLFHHVAGADTQYITQFHTRQGDRAAASPGRCATGDPARSSSPIDAGVVETASNPPPTRVSGSSTRHGNARQMTDSIGSDDVVYYYPDSIAYYYSVFARGDDGHWVPAAHRESEAKKRGTGTAQMASSAGVCGRAATRRSTPNSRTRRRASRAVESKLAVGPGATAGVGQVVLVASCRVTARCTHRRAPSRGSRPRDDGAGGLTARSTAPRHPFAKHDPSVRRACDSDWRGIMAAAAPPAGAADW